MEFKLTDPVIEVKYPYTGIQKKFIRDLETTEEPQTKGRLHRLIESSHDPKKHPIGFCCLGRIYILIKAKGELSEHNTVMAYNSSSGALTESVRRKFKLNGNLGEFSHNHSTATVVVTKNDKTYHATSLADLNDGAELTFKEIARFIKQYPYLLFNNI